MDKESFQKKITALLDGKEKPDNEAIAFILQRFRDSRTDLAQVSVDIRKKEQHMKELRQTAERLEGSVSSYARDLEQLLGVGEKIDVGDNGKSKEKESATAKGKNGDNVEGASA